MAEARLTLSSEVGTFVRGVRTARGEFDQLYTAVRDNWWGIRNVGLAFAAVGGAIAAGTAAAVKAASEFEAGMVGVARTTREMDQTAADSVKSIGPLGEELRKLALIRPVGIDQIMRIAEEAGALGVARQDIAEFTKTIVDLVATTNLTEASATQLAKIAGVVGVPAREFDNLGSSVLEVGVRMAATETQILNMAKRIAPAGATANMTAGEIIGLSGAVLSLGPNAEAGGTAIQRTLYDMSDAIGAGGDELKLFARVAGVTTDEFARVFRENGGNALTLFIEGLGRLGGDMVKTGQVLDALGINEQRQIIALTSLAKGTVNSTNENVKLRNALKLGNEAYKENTSLAGAAAEVNKTTAAQWTLMKNAIKDAAIVLGGIFLPVIRPVINFVANLAAGIGALPAPLRIAMQGLVIMAGALAALAAGFLILGPRVVLALGSFKVFAATLHLGAAAAGAEGAAAAKAAAPTSALGAAAARVATASKGATAGLASMRAAAATEATAAGVAAANTNALAVAEARAGGAAAMAAPQIAALAQAQWAAGATAGASAAMIPGLVAGTAATGATAAASAGRFAIFGAVLGRLGGVIKTIGSFLLKYLKNPLFLALAAVVGLTMYTAKLGKDQREAAEAAMDQGDATSDLSKRMKDAAKKSSDLQKAQEKSTEALRKQAEAIKEQNQAIMHLADAQFAARDAERSLTEATKNLLEARKDAASNLEEIEEAELALTQAQLNADRAARNLAKAQKKLATARADQLEDLEDAERDLTDAQRDYEDSLVTVAEKQEALNKLMAGPSARELREATLKLKDAQLSLMKATRKVSDAQWYLNYLMEEGASERDIADAQLLLAEAQHEVEDATEDVSKAQEEYNDLLEVTPEERAAAERDLADAVRDSEDALRDVEEAEEAVQQLREDVANDTAYKEALADVTDAQIANAEAARDLAEARTALSNAKLGTDDTTALVAAQDAYTDALYRVAKARTDLEVTTRRARGEEVTASQEAAILAENLRRVGAVGPEFQPLLNALGNVRNEIDTTKSKANDLNGLMDGLDFGEPDVAGGINSGMEKGRTAAETQRKSLWESTLDYVQKNWPLIGAAMVGGLVAGLLGAPVLLGAAVGTIVYQVGKWAYEKLPDSWKSAIEEWGRKNGERMRTQWNNLTTSMGPLLSEFATNVGNWLSGAGKTLGHNFGVDFGNGFGKEDVKGFFKRQVEAFVRQAFGPIGSIVAELAGTAARNMPRPFKDAINTVIDYFNSFLAMVGQIKITMPEFKTPFGGPTIGGWSFQFPTWKVPRLAEGGVTQGAMMAIIGEDGQEAVVPLDRLWREFNRMDALGDAMAETQRTLESLIAMSANNTTVAGGDTFNLTALTDADPFDIADEFMWAKMVRSR